MNLSLLKAIFISEKSTLEKHYYFDSTIFTFAQIFIFRYSYNLNLLKECNQRLHDLVVGFPLIHFHSERHKTVIFRPFQDPKSLNSQQKCMFCLDIWAIHNHPTNFSQNEFLIDWKFCIFFNNGLLVEKWRFTILFSIFYLVLTECCLNGNEGGFESKRKLKFINPSKNIHHWPFF